MWRCICRWIPHTTIARACFRLQQQLIIGFDDGVFGKQQRVLGSDDGLQKIVKQAELLMYLFRRAVNSLTRRIKTITEAYSLLFILRSLAEQSCRNTTLTLQPPLPAAAQSANRAA
jgi:hypothetical protein